MHDAQAAHMLAGCQLVPSQSCHWPAFRCAPVVDARVGPIDDQVEQQGLPQAAQHAVAAAAVEVAAGTGRRARRAGGERIRLGDRWECPAGLTLWPRACRLKELPMSVPCANPRQAT